MEWWGRGSGEGGGGLLSLCVDQLMRPFSHYFDA